MACACKVNRDIERINSYYSYNRASSGSRGRMRVNKKDAALTALVYLLLLPLVPVMFVGVIIFSMASKDGLISFRKFLGFIHKVRNGGKQQII